MTRKGFILMKFPLIAFSVIYSFGVVFAYFFDMSLLVNISVLAVFAVIVLAYNYWVPWRDKEKTILLLCLIFIFSTTINLFRFQSDRNEKYGRIETEFIVKKLYSANKYFQSAIVEDVISKDKYLAKLSTSDSVMNNGDRFFARGEIGDLPRLSIPNSFNFSEYLKRNGVRKSIRITSKIKTDSRLSGSVKLSRFISDRLDSSRLSGESKAMLKALILGQKDEIEVSTMKSFSDSGIMHLLALSGLHIGILTWFLAFLFRPFLFFKYGNVYRSVLIILSLWFYAYITGFPSSILRATVMFSVFTIARELKRGSNVFNSIAISALILLVIDPNNLFDVGFQLSFAAVIGIVWMFPLLENNWMPRNKVGKYLWSLILVSVVAQVATLPFTIFYFHKFSSMFLVANFIEIPLVSVLLMMSYLFVVLLMFRLPSDLLTYGIDVVSNLIREVSLQISSFREFIFEDLFLNGITVIILYLIIITVLLAIQKKKVFYVFSILILILGLQIFTVNNKYRKNITSELMIVGGKKADIILRDGVKAIINGEESNKSKFENYIHAENLDLSDSILPRLFMFKDDLYWQLDSDISENPIMDNHFVIVGNDTKSNPNDVVNSFTQGVIVTAYTNSFINSRWQYFCNKHKMPFHCASDSLYSAN